MEVGQDETQQDIVNVVMHMMMARMQEADVTAVRSFLANDSVMHYLATSLTGDPLRDGGRGLPRLLWHVGRTTAGLRGD